MKHLTTLGIGGGGSNGAVFRADNQGLRTHHVLRDKHIKVQAVFTDAGRRGCAGAWLPAAGPADTGSMTSRSATKGTCLVFPSCPLSVRTHCPGQGPAGPPALQRSGSFGQWAEGMAACERDSGIPAPLCRGLRRNTVQGHGASSEKDAHDREGGGGCRSDLGSSMQTRCGPTCRACCLTCLHQDGERQFQHLWPQGRRPVWAMSNGSMRVPTPLGALCTPPKPRSCWTRRGQALRLHPRASPVTWSHPIMVKHCDWCTCILFLSPWGRPLHGFLHFPASARA